MSKPPSAAPIQQQGKKNSSATNAKAAFRSFSLSKIPKAKPKRTYVAKGEDVAARQRSLIKSQLTKFPPGGPGLTIVISDPKALNMEDSKIDLSTLIDAMDKAKQGAQFYTSGTSVTEQIDNQKQVEDFFRALKDKNNAQPE